MDFDSFITFILILLFFVGPTILKQWQKKQQKSSSKSSQQGKTSKQRKAGLFGKIGDQIQQFIKDLEEQALEAKRQAGQEQGQQTVWEDLREEEQDDDFYGSLDEAGLPYYQETEIKEEPIPEPVHVKSTPDPIQEDEYRNAPSSGGQFRSSQLQNAIVWSEILSKPIALRED